MDRKDSNSCSIQFFLLGKVITQKGLVTLGQSFLCAPGMYMNYRV
ncbi:hypothetical protein BSM4216_2892 [Bacillus smithii]|nr:hypothetical protein BSM4216_2892 [Bacillus smithii]